VRSQTPHPRLGLSTSKVAQQLGVSLGTVRRWSDLGHLRAYRTPGGQRRFSPEHVEEFLRSLEQDPDAFLGPEHEIDG
jgi:excisionase family DNA binding protein